MRCRASTDVIVLWCWPGERIVNSADELRKIVEMFGLKSRVRSPLIDKIRARQFEIYPPRLIYAQQELHAQIKKLFASTRGYFFEVGANDGLNQSNTAYLEKYEGWHGILVEPLPMQFRKCVANRPAATVINAALVSRDFSGRTVEISYANLMSTVNDPERNLLSVESHVATGSQFLTEDEKALSGHPFIVPALTVSAVLDNAGQARVDFFSLDVEGYEAEVLKGIDFSRHRPRYFLIEARDKPQIDRFMAAQEYRYVARWSEQDFLYTDRA
jgi:FkbM family methyltransferase